MFACFLTQVQNRYIPHGQLLLDEVTPIDGSQVPAPHQELLPWFQRRVLNGNTEWTTRRNKIVLNLDDAGIIFCSCNLHFVFGLNIFLVKLLYYCVRYKPPLCTCALGYHQSMWYLDQRNKHCYYFLISLFGTFWCQFFGRVNNLFSVLSTFLYLWHRLHYKNCLILVFKMRRKKNITLEFKSKISL